MTALEASRCRFCTKRFHYSGAYDRHVAREHPSALQWPSIGNRQHDAGSETPGSDYEDLLNNSSPCQGNPEYNFETLGSLQPDLPTNGTPPPESTLEVYPESGRPIRDAPEIAEEASRLLQDPWYPFSNPHEFKQARWMIESSLSKSSVDRYFCDGRCTSSEVAFTSGWTLYKQLDRMYPELGPDSWKIHEANWSLDVGRSRRTTYYYRSPLSCIEYLLKQACFRDHLVYAPVREYNQAGERMYSEMHTADWWWSTQVRYSPLRYTCYTFLTIRRIPCR